MDDRRHLIKVLQDNFIYREEGWLWAFMHDAEGDSVLLAITRADGVPCEVDREFWRALKARMAAGPTRLVDLVVVGPDRIWSAQQEDRERAALA